MIVTVIATYNPDLTILKDQYDSVENQVDSIVYIDNGSKNIEEIKRFLKQSANASKVALICNHTNMGLGYAQNQGINKAKELGCTHVLLLDHDSVIEKTFVTNLLHAEEDLLHKSVKIGAVGPVFYSSETGVQYPVSLVRKFKIEKLYPSKYDTSVSFLIASGSMIRREVLDAVGLMNEGLFVDTIDIEWSFRTIAKGYSLYVTPKAQMKHKIGDRRITFLGRNISYHSPLRRYYLCRNCVHMFRFKYIPLPFKLRALFLNFARIVAMMVNSKDNRWNYLKYCSIGFWDGLRGVKGRCLLGE